MQENLFVFGNCSASYLALGMAKLKQDGISIPYERIGYWAMPADQFNLEQSCIFMMTTLQFKIRQKSAEVIKPRDNASNIISTKEYQPGFISLRN